MISILGYLTNDIYCRKMEEKFQFSYSHAKNFYDGKQMFIWNQNNMIHMTH